ncbi:MAG: hypothetical protein WCK17_14065, partial [Verrucomicrobiota bacterium]
VAMTSKKVARGGTCLRWSFNRFAEAVLLLEILKESRSAIRIHPTHPAAKFLRAGKRKDCNCKLRSKEYPG